MACRDGGGGRGGRVRGRALAGGPEDQAQDVEMTSARQELEGKACKSCTK